MGEAAKGGASAAGGNSLMSLGLSAYSTMLSAEGTASADEFQAAKLDNAATYGRLKAVQTGGQMTRSLVNTLGNIQAVRAAANTDPTSPTGAAVLENQEAIGNEQRSTTVNSILAQANQDSSDANYYRKAADHALLAGGISAAAGVAKGIAGMGIFGG